MSEVMVGALKDFQDGSCRVFSVGGFEVGIFRRGAKLFAYENRCPHYGGPVCQGGIFHRVEEKLGTHRVSIGLQFAAAEHIVCPWHGYEYDLATGRHPGDPKLRLTRVEVKVRAGKVFVAMAAEPAGSMDAH